MYAQSWEFWLMMTNYALAVVVALALLVVSGAVAWELTARNAQKVRSMVRVDQEMWAMLHGGAHSLSVPGLGLTMAYVGEEVKTSENGSEEEKL